MATSKAVRADDVSGLNIATVSNSEDAVTKDWQRVVINDPTTVGNMAGVDGSGNLKITGTVTANAGSGTQAVRPSDGTNAVTKTFDLDSGAGAEWNLGVGLRKAASGGSVESGTASDPIRTDTTGTTVQPVSGTVTANIGTSGSLALDATLTGGLAKAIARGGAKGATTAADVTSTAEGTDHQALDIQIYHGGAAKDPTQIRALTNADVVKAQLQDNGGTAITLGQKTKASSVPVVLASDEDTLPVSGTVSVNSLPAGSNAIGKVTLNAPTTAALSSASISFSGSGDNTLVSAVGGQTVRVHRLWLVVAGDTNLIFKDGTAGTALNGAATMFAGGSMQFGFESEPWFVTSTANAFVLNSSVAVQVSGRIYYTQS